jgi:DNA ligase-1
MIFKTLYKRSTTGKISEWTIETETNKFRTMSGFTDGQKVISEWTVCEAKSYCTAEEQAQKQAKALHKKKMDLGAFEDIKDIDKPIFFKPMLAHDYNDYKDKIKYPVATQPKLDGVRCIIDIDGMRSRNGKELISAPHIHDALKPLFEKYPDLVFDGELYAHKSDGVDFNKIISCVRKTKPTPNDIIESKQYIQYWIYDLPSHVGAFTERYKTLLELDLPECCIIVKTEQADNKNDISAYYSDYMADGYEGQMIRVLDSEYENKRSKHLLKHKSFMDDEFEIKGVVEGKGKLTGKIGKLVFDGFDSAVNGDHEYLEMLFKRGDLIGKKATVKYFELTTDGVPRFPKVIAIRDFE